VFNSLARRRDGAVIENTNEKDEQSDGSDEDSEKQLFKYSVICFIFNIYTIKNSIWELYSVYNAQVMLTYSNFALEN